MNVVLDIKKLELVAACDRLGRHVYVRNVDVSSLRNIFLPQGQGLA